MTAQHIGPLISLVSIDDVQGEAKKIFEKIEKKNGKIPKWMRVMGNSEDTFVNFFKLFTTIMNQGKVDSLLKWKIAYRVSELNKCEFCVSATKIQLKNLGLSDEKISQIDQATNEKEIAALEFAEASTEHAYRISPEIKDKITKFYSDEEIVEISSAIGLFNFINKFNDSLDVFPDL